MRKIKIETVKIVDRGEQKIFIDQIYGLQRKDLPLEYFESVPCVWVEEYHDREAFVYLKRVDGQLIKMPLLSKNINYDPQSFAEKLVLLHNAGERLARINASLKEKNKDWYGSETYII